MKKKLLVLSSLILIVLTFSACTILQPTQTVEEQQSENDMQTSEDTMETDSSMLGMMVDGYYDVTPEEAQELIDSMPELVIIDVSPLFDQGHIPGAVNFYVGDGSLDEAIPTFDNNKTYLVYCHSDVASISGATKLVEAGFMNVYRLKGNFGAWVDAGFEVEKPMEAEMDSDMEAKPMMIGEMVDGYYDVTPEQAKELIESMPELVIIDVSPLFNQGHIPGGVNFYVGDGSLDDAIPTLDENKTYLVYCHSDGASISGATKLVEAGFMNVYRLKGNFGAWVDAGFEVEK